MQFSVGVVPQPLRIMQKVAMGYSVVQSIFYGVHRFALVLQNVNKVHE